ncbi:alpha/beta hydrolase [Microbacterium sp.]|uniref:alpha/beta hydrolase n=1 Tax=Microbacterium sp. TaxID=51671 RepID=UPI003A923970
MSSTPSPTAVFTPASRARGTLALIPGRDETAAVYRRFGTRISADGYGVGVFAEAGAAIAWLREQESPRVLVGSDAGATAVLTALAQGDVADAAIVAGVVVDPERIPTDAERTACPVHLGVLAEQHADTSLRLAAARSAQATGSAPQRTGAPELPAPADLAAISVPVLAVHGGADPVSPFAQARAALSAVPDLEILETVDGLHDALNDASHRSVAAGIVLWLERLRAGDVHTAVVRAIDTTRAAAAA